MKVMIMTPTEQEGWICKVCETMGGHTQHIVREMMLGYRHDFIYFECSSCGCLQIANAPGNIAAYYPPNYYSFSSPNKGRNDLIAMQIKRLRTHAYIKRKGFVANVLTRIFGEPALPEWVRKAGLSLRSDILDVGCGAGHLLVYLQGQGFSRLTGIDPYIKSDIVYDNGVRIRKQELKDVKLEFDVIMFHHSFEHMDDPASVFHHLSRITKPRGLVLLRIPTVSSYAWRVYGTNWVQLDAPRHFFLHSITSIKHLAHKTGFTVECVDHDSTEFQFWGSEQYLRDIPLTDERSYLNNPGRSLFSKDEIACFRKKSEELNAVGDGDQACFYLRRNHEIHGGNAAPASGLAGISL